MTQFHHKFVEIYHKTIISWCIFTKNADEDRGVFAHQLHEMISDEAPNFE